MLRLTEVASQSVTFVKLALSKAKTETVNSLNEMDGPSGHYLVVFSLDRPPLLAVGRRRAGGASNTEVVSCELALWQPAGTTLEDPGWKRATTEFDGVPLCILYHKVLSP